MPKNNPRLMSPRLTVPTRMCPVYNRDTRETSSGPYMTQLPARIMPRVRDRVGAISTDYFEYASASRVSTYPPAPCPSGIVTNPHEWFAQGLCVPPLRQTRIIELEAGTKLGWVNGNEEPNERSCAQYLPSVARMLESLVRFLGPSIAC